MMTMMAAKANQILLDLAVFISNFVFYLVSIVGLKAFNSL